jgi:hypothetical protein
MRRAEEGRGPAVKFGLNLTLKPEVVAQTLSPAMLTMQALSMWPEPTRLAGQS